MKNKETNLVDSGKLALVFNNDIPYDTSLYKFSMLILKVKNDDFCKLLLENHLGNYADSIYTPRSLMNILTRVKPGIHLNHEKYDELLIALLTKTDFLTCYILNSDATDKHTIKKNDQDFNQVLKFFDVVSSERFKKIKYQCQTQLKPIFFKPYTYDPLIKIYPWLLFEEKYKAYTENKTKLFKEQATFLLMAKKQNTLFKLLPKPIIYKIAEEIVDYPASKAISK